MTSIVFTAEKFQIGAGLSGYVAEITAAFSCASLGIEPTVRHAGYVGAWLEVLKEDSRAIIRAASLASKASDFLLGHLGERGKAEATETDSELQEVETESDAEAA